MNTNEPTWPNDVDGDVFRRLLSSGFDFSKVHTIDFNIDFEEWPPSAEAVQFINDIFPDAQICENDEGKGNYILFKLSAKPTYEFVMNTQAQVSAMVARFGGHCDSWGILF